MSDAQRHWDYVDHMLEAIQLSTNYVDGLGREDFLDDKRTQQAVILNFLTIGEAASHLARIAPEFIRQHPQVPWSQMRGMRNRLAYGYFDINLDVVWDTLQTALPELQRQLLAIKP